MTLPIAIFASSALSLPLVVPFGDACTVHPAPEGSSLLRAPSLDFVLGTDTVGRSEALRLAFALRTSVALALPATLFATMLAALLGAVAAHAAAHRRSAPLRLDFDHAISFIADVLLALPFVLVVAAAAALVDDVTPLHLVCVMTLAALPATTKLVRDRGLFRYARGYVHAAHAMGGSLQHVLAWHIVAPSLRFALTLAPTTFAQLVVTEAALGYLGLGLAPPAATLGTMLADGQDSFADAPWLLVAPTVVLVALVLGAEALARELRGFATEADHG